MLKIRVVALFIAAFLAFSPQSARAQALPDPCAADVMTDLTTSAQSGYDKLNNLVTSIMKPPQSAMSSGCMRDLFNIWDTDLVGTVAGAVASLVGGFSIGGGITLTESTSYGMILGAINSMLSSQLGNLVCPDMWKGVASAMAPVTINADGSFGLGSVPGISLSGGVISIP